MPKASGTKAGTRFSPKSLWARITFRPAQAIWLLATLFGLSLTLCLLGYVQIFSSILGPGTLVEQVVLGMFLLGAAVGPPGARRVALLIGRVSGSPAIGPRQSINDAADGDLPWLLHAILGCLTGGLMIVGLVGAGLVGVVWPVLSDGFFWTPMAEAACFALLIGGSLGLLSLTVGVQVVGLYRLALRLRAERGLAAPSTQRKGPYRDPRTGRFARRAPAVPTHESPGQASVRAAGVTGSLFLGVAIGLGVYHSDHLRLAADQWVLLAAALMFGIAACSALITRRVTVPSGADRAAAPTEDAICSIHDPSIGMTLAAAWAWGISVGLWCCAWRFAAGGFVARFAVGHPGWLFAAITAGVGLSSWLSKRRKYSMGGFGVSLLLAGGGMLLAVGVVTLLPVPSVLSILVWLAAGVGIGQALPYGRRAFVGRSASERQGLMRWLGATLCGLVVGFWGAAGFEVWTAQPMAAVAGACLLLLIAGGLLQIHEQSGSVHVRQRRLGAVYVMLGLALLVLPAGARRAARRWPATDGPIAASLVTPLGGERGLVGPGARVAVIGDRPFLAAPASWRLSQIGWSSSRRRSLADGGVVLSVSADRWWRRDRQRYDLIVQDVEGLLPLQAAEHLSWEWFCGLRDRLTRTGVLFVSLPVDRLEPSAVGAVVRAFDRAMGAYICAGIRAEDGGAVYLLAVPPAAGREAGDGFAPPALNGMDVLALPAEASGGTVNRIRALAFAHWSAQEPISWPRAAVSGRHAASPALADADNASRGSGWAW